MNALCVAAVLISAPLVPEADEVERELAALQGKWKLVRLRIHGNDWFNADDPREDVKDIGETMVIRGTMMVGGENKTERKAFKILATTPRAIDIATVVPAGPTWRVQGDWTHGIYGRHGDRLTFCQHCCGVRPSNFGPDDKNLAIVVYERVR